MRPSAQTPPRWPPTPQPAAAATGSKWAPHRAFIDAQLRLGRNATAIYQDLVDLHGFEGTYNSVKRFVAQCIDPVFSCSGVIVERKHR